MLSADFELGDGVEITHHHSQELSPARAERLLAASPVGWTEP